MEKIVKIGKGKENKKIEKNRKKRKRGTEKNRKMNGIHERGE